jgi:tryptophan synthase alpha chain
MSRIPAIFDRLKAENRKALMPFLCAGDPSLELTEQLLPVLEQAGASVVELGVPFSDPIADGPTIQAAMSRALEAGLTVDRVLEMVRRVRPKVQLGLVAMVSYSIVHRRGLQRFVKEAVDAGIDGFIFPDMPWEEADTARQAAQQAGAILSMLIAPTTPDGRAEQIAKASSGFVYVVSRPGITGEQAALPEELPVRLGRLRGVTDLPLAVGFGISSPEQVRAVVRHADAAIVGSALVRRLHEQHQDQPDGVVRAGQAFVRELADGLV